MSKTAILWFRRDLRVCDHPAIDFAISNDYQIIPLFIWDDTDPKPPGAASRWWLHKSLNALSQKLGHKIVLRRGTPHEILSEMLSSDTIGAVFWSRCYDRHSIDRDTKIKDQLQKSGVFCKSFNANLLVEPWEIKPKAGDFYKVFTPFWKELQKVVSPKIYSYSIKDCKIAPHAFASDQLVDWGLLPSSPDWSIGFNWYPGEDGASSRLDDFLDNGILGYKENRNYPALDSTSKLSPHLAWGEISPQRIWQQTSQHSITKFGHMIDDTMNFLSEIAWREFSYHLLFHFPNLGSEPFKAKFKNFPWQDNDDLFAKWTRGETGYPLVDAGMRELWSTGWMHNRVRMIVASFLVKDLLIPWQRGEAWFWDTLVDADHANNTASWQWVAGCGADAAPYFRIFNPVTQAEKFDPHAEYIKQYIPEYGTANYPPPIIDHAKARELALRLIKD